MSRTLRPFFFAAAVIVLSIFIRAALSSAAPRRASAAGCIGEASAPLRMVYLHGLDTYGPSWKEVENRETLRALAHAVNARIALPRTRGFWPQGHPAARATARSVIADAAGRCFDGGAEYGLLGFSNGANLVNELFIHCDEWPAPWMISIGGEGSARNATAAHRRCGRLIVIAGRHEPTYRIAANFASRLAKLGADVRLIEHSGAHEIPFAETALALRSVR